MTSLATDRDLRIEAKTPRLGAVVHGLDAKQEPSPEVVRILKDAIHHYKVLFLPDQHLSATEQATFAAYFGAPLRRGARIDPDYEETGLSGITVVSHFHSDLMYRAEQPAYAMLQLLEIPPAGGDTMWADLVSSYEDLSAPMRLFLETLTAVHGHPDFYLSDQDLATRYREVYGGELTPEGLATRRNDSRPRTHPLVRLIPETGRKNYWISAQHTQSIEGLTKSESDALLAMLFAHQLRPEYIVRWQWHVGDIAFWDHRTTLHAGVHDYGDFPRRGQRANIDVVSPIAAR
jgi:taurine dioxygenase